MTRAHRHTAAVLLLSLVVVPRLHAQGEETIRLRRTASDSIVAQGRLVGRAGGKIVIEAEGERGAYAISDDYVLERFHIKRRTGAGAAAGLAVGFLAAVVIVPADTTTCPLGDMFCKPPISGTQFAGFILGAGLGAAAGALVGSLFRGEGWSAVDPYEVPDSPTGISLTLSPMRVGLSVSLRW